MIDGMKCRICGTEIEPFMSFGKMPIANGFLSQDQFGSEYFFDLQVCFCPTCGMVQLAQQPDRAMMFHDNYAFYSSTSTRMADHFKDWAVSVMYGLVERDDPFVVEIGSNDGIMLQHFAKAGFSHLGIEPSANVADAARMRGVRTVSQFFDDTLAREIVSEEGQADIILAANVMCHIPDLHSVVAGIAHLLKPNGMMIFQDPYLCDIVEMASYDQIYDEHCYYFSVGSIRYLFEQYGMEVVNLQHQDVHGGSMRYMVTHKGKLGISPAVTSQLIHEQGLGIDQAYTYDGLRKRIETSRMKLATLLDRFRAEKKRVVGYAATSKSTTVTNYCGITPQLVEYISDTTPIKIGKYSPGAHIPVRSHDEFAANYPDYALLFGWNHAREIMANEQAFKDAGGKWIVYVPEVKVI